MGNLRARRGVVRSHTSTCASLSVVLSACTIASRISTRRSKYASVSKVGATFLIAIIAMYRTCAS